MLLFIQMALTKTKQNKKLLLLQGEEAVFQSGKMGVAGGPSGQMALLFTLKRLDLGELPGKWRTREA